MNDRAYEDSKRTAVDSPDDGRVIPLGEAVRRRRHEFGLRQTELADLAGCSQRFVHTVEQGKPSLRLDKVLDVLEVLGLGLRVVPGRGQIAASSEREADPAELE